MPVTRVSHHESEVDQVAEGGAQRGATNIKRIGQGYKFGPRSLVQLRDDRNVPAVMHQLDQEFKLLFVFVHLTNYILTIKLEPQITGEGKSEMSSTPNYADGLTLSMPVANLETSIDWYERVLGFSLLYRVDELGWCELQSAVDKVNVGLSVVESPNPGGATPTFGVSDIDEAKATLEAAGVKIDGDIMIFDNMVKLITFYDPDDNSLMFYEKIGDGD